MGTGDFTKWLQFGGDGVRFEAGTRIFAAGEGGTTMFIVRQGAVEIRVEDQLLERVDAGGVIGEMALVDEAPRSASAHALSDCELIPVDRRRFMYLVQETPTFALEVMRVFAARLRRMNERFD